MPPTVSIQVFSIGRGKYHRHSDVCDTTPMFVLGADMNYLPLPLPPSHPAPQDYPYTPRASLPSSHSPPPLRHPHLPLSRLLPVGSSTDMWASCSSYLSLHKSFFFSSNCQGILESQCIIALCILRLKIITTPHIPSKLATLPTYLTSSQLCAGQSPVCVCLCDAASSGGPRKPST